MNAAKAAQARNTFRFGALTLDAPEFGSQGSAILGIRDSGKTYSATALAERMFDAGVPFVAFDPIGVWRFLRVPGEQRGGRGFPIVVAGGVAGDLPLSPTTAPAIVEAAMREGVSLVIDLFHIDLSKADWRRIVRDSVRLLLHKNKPHGLRHVFLEEAAEFAPQKVLDGEVYAEIEKLARMGGNSRLGYTLINQRAEEVNKAVLELCDNLFLHRQKGRNSLTALSKWLDVGRVKEGKAIIESLATLPQGECWAWLAGADHATRIKGPRKFSLHPDRRVMRGDEDAAPSKDAIDVGQFVKAMQEALPKLAAEADANDPKKLSDEIKRLTRALADAEARSNAPSPNAQAADAIRQKAFAEGAASRQPDIDDAYRRGFDDATRKAAEALANVSAPPPPKPAPARAPAEVRPLAPPIPHPVSEPPMQPTAPRPARPPSPPPSGDDWIAAARKIWPATLTWAQLGATIGKKASGGYFYSMRKGLLETGQVREQSGRVVLADPPNAQGVAAADILSQALPEPSRKMFVALRARSMSAHDLAETLGMKPSGGYWFNGLSILRTAELIEESGGILRIADRLETL